MRWRRPGAEGPDLDGIERFRRLTTGLTSTRGHVGKRGAESPMPLEVWIQHSRVDQFLYDWQTVIAGGLALLAGVIAVCVDAERHISHDPRADRDDRSLGTGTRCKRIPSISRHARSGDGSRPRRGGLGQKEISAAYDADETGRRLPMPSQPASPSPKARSRNCAPLASGRAAL